MLLLTIVLNAKHHVDYGNNLLRLDASSGDGKKVITPIRPVAILGHNLDLREETVRLI